MNLILFLLPFVVTILVGWVLIKQSRHKNARIELTEYVTEIKYTTSDDRLMGHSTTDDVSSKCIKTKKSDVKALTQGAETMLKAFTE